jgi:glycosyltransferase involved in cell wall biosynthesis
MNSMRILCVSNHFPPAHVGGYELFCADTVDSLRQRGHDVIVVTSNTEAPSEPGVLRDLAFDAAMADPVAMDMNRSVIADAVTRYSPDTALVWNTYGLGHEAVFDTLCAKVPTACYLMLHDLAYYGPASLRAVRMVASSQVIRFHFLRRGFSTSALPLIYPGVELPASVRCHTDEAVRLLYCGRVISYKGPHVALVALEKLPAAYTLTVIGIHESDSEYGDQLHGWVSEHGLEDRVTFRGQLPRDRALEEYLRHDVLVFPSLWEEPLGLVVLEAMAAGLPVAASRRGAPVELITHGRTGLLHEPGDPQDLARTLLALSSIQVRSEMGAAAREDVRRRFALQRYVGQLEAELNALAFAT